MINKFHIISNTSTEIYNYMKRKKNLLEDF
jgi:hypothetical protein